MTQQIPLKGLAPDGIRQLRWAYGVTTVPERRDTLLPLTLASLALAGFDKPRLFIDGSKYPYEELQWRGLEQTLRWPKVRTVGNWILALWELYLHNPESDRFALFQDDLVAPRNLRQYLERVPYPDEHEEYQGAFMSAKEYYTPLLLNGQSSAYYSQSGSSNNVHTGGVNGRLLNSPRIRGYWNLYTFKSNQTLCPRERVVIASVRQQDKTEIVERERVGWFESRLVNTNDHSQERWQTGRGAVGLVFSREAVMTLLSSRSLVNKIQDVHTGHRKLDGGIVTAMNLAGYREFVHNPSLLQHTGDRSTMGNLPHEKAPTFPGEDFDCLSLLPGGVANPVSCSSLTTPNVVVE